MGVIPPPIVILSEAKNLVTLLSQCSTGLWPHQTSVLTFRIMVNYQQRLLFKVEKQMTLIDDIRSDLINESADLANTLRKAKILASELGVSEFRDWVDSELNGYSDISKLPNYRRFRPQNVGTFAGSFQRWMENVPLPTYNLPDEVKEFAENLEFLAGVGELEAMLTQENEYLRKPWPQEGVILARQVVKMSGGMELVEAHQPILSSTIAGILHNVKNKLLDFILGLQENNVTSANLNSGEVKQEEVRNLFNINIYGDHNVVASGESVQQQVRTIRRGDVESLVHYLRQHKVGKSDLRALEKAVSAEPVNLDGRFGPKVQAWVGKMIGKASSGVWKIGLASAPAVLMEALRRYYGGSF